jgi:aarF domain-containing kinase
VRDVLAGKGLNCYCKMLLRDNFIHGDLHPGNILVDARDPANPVVTLIDVGLCQKMTIREGQLTHELMGAFVRWVPGACSTALWNMGDEQLYADKAKFDGDMVDLFKRFRPISGDEVEVVNNVLQAVFDVVRVNRVTMEPTFVSILFAVLVLESFIMALNPEFNMVRHASGWLVSEGHISKKLFKNIAYSAEDIVRSRARMLKARLTGQSEKEDYVPAQRRRMEERMLAEHQERFGAATPVPVAVAA